MNRALLKLGAGRIAAPTDDSEQARVLGVVFDSLARAELRRQAWSFALKRDILPETTAPAFGYSHAYNLPPECLRLVMIHDRWVLNETRGFDDDRGSYAIEGRSLLINGGGALRVRYVTDLSQDTSIWDPAFTEAFICRLAGEVGPSLTKGKADVRQVKADYVAALNEAKRVNAIELPPTMMLDDSWVTSRYR
jgi:hypothetical protein